MPAEIIKLPESEQHDRDAAEQEHQADGAPHQRAAGVVIADQRVVRKVVGVGVRAARPLGGRGPGRPDEERGELAQLDRIGDGAPRKPAILRGVGEVVRPVCDLLGECRLVFVRQGQRACSRVVSVGLEFRRNRAVYGAFSLSRRLE